MTGDKENGIQICLTSLKNLEKRTMELRGVNDMVSVNKYGTHYVCFNLQRNGYDNNFIYRSVKVDSMI